MQRPEPTPDPTRILLVEDNVDHATLAKRGLSEDTFEVKHVRTGADAMDAIENGSFALCLLDHRLPDTEGVRLCRRLRDAGHEGLIWLVTGATRDRLVDRAFEAGADDYLVKGPSLATRIQENLQSALGVENT